MTHIDLYAAYRLDRSAPPQALAAALTSQLQSADPRDALTRGRIETARAILGDPAKRAAYDRQLTDPAAPPITEQTLAQLAGVPVAQPVPQRRSGLFSNPKTQILSGVAALLALILVVTVAAVSCGGGSSSPDATSGPDGAADDSVVSCRLQSNRQIDDAEWGKKKSRQPRVVIVLDKAIDLPSEFNQLTFYTSSGASGNDPRSEGLTQYPDGSVGVVITDGGGGAIPKSFGLWYQQSMVTIATVSPDGAVTSTRKYRYGVTWDSPLPKSITPHRDRLSGYLRIQASNGIEIPSAAESSEQSKVYTLSVLPDSNDPNVAWVLLLGSSKLYKATLYRATGTDATDLGTVIDPSKCTK